MKKYAIFTAFTVLLGYASAFGYGAAGCGVGSMVFADNNAWWAQTLAATTNGISGNQTFGITTGTLGCDANALISQMEKTKVFIEANKSELSNDIARGEGESLVTLSKIMNCNSTAFNSSLQTSYAQIFTGAEDSAEAVTLRVYTVLDKTNACQASI